ncbi:MAG: hypothetical protein ACK4KW_14690 [Gemmobacter sp.]
MRHFWIIEVLADLAGFARANDMPRLAAKAEEALNVARAEIAARAGAGKT